MLLDLCILLSAFLKDHWNLPNDKELRTGKLVCVLLLGYSQVSRDGAVLVTCR